MSLPAITVIVPHHLDNNKSYLDLCIRALMASKCVDLEVLLIASSTNPPEEYPGVKVIWDRHSESVSAKLNRAFEYDGNHEGWIRPASTHVALISDDVVISEYMLHDMVGAMKGRDLIMNPMSNSDCTSVYEADIKLKRVHPNGAVETLPLKPDMELKDIEEWEEFIIHYPPKPKCLFPVRTLSFFCTLMPVGVWKKVGPLDPQLEYRFNDTDFCLRAAQFSIPCVINLGAFAFHFGSRTIRQVATKESQDLCTAHFNKKWQFG